VHRSWKAVSAEANASNQHNADHVIGAQIEQLNATTVLFSYFTYLVLPCTELRRTVIDAAVDTKTLHLVQQSGFLSRWNLSVYHRMRLLLMARDMAMWGDNHPKFWAMFERRLNEWLLAYERDSHNPEVRDIIPNLYYAEQALLFLCKDIKARGANAQGREDMRRLSDLLLRLKGIRLQAEEEPQNTYEVAKESTISESQTLMYATLEELVKDRKIDAFSPEYDACAEDKDTRGLGMYRIDAAVPSMKLAIEFEG
jgi:hypothetical protein